MTAELPAWRGPDGNVLECTEKLRVLAENEAELVQVMRDAWEDAEVMGVAPEAMQTRLQALVSRLFPD